MKRLVRSAIAGLSPLVERWSGSKVLLIPQWDLHAVPERVHLRKFIDYFGIDCIFDVGANMGQYATMLRTQVGYKGLIVSFEPIPECAEHLRALSRQDPLWQVEEVALSDRVGVDTFNIMVSNQFSSLGSPDHSGVDIFEESNKISRSIRVQVDTLAPYFEKYREKFHFSRPFLKLDTQGADVKVVAGAAAIMREIVGLQSELSIVKIYDESTRYTDAINFYESLGFRLSALVPNNAGHFPRLVEIDCIMFNADLAAGVHAGRP